jgi:RNA polymerase sigma-54 factor
MAYKFSQEANQKQELSQKQTQRLMLSHEMQQALHILQLPILELSQEIDQELESNPILEVSEVEQEEDDETESEDFKPEKEMDFDDNNFEVLQQIDQEFSDLVLDPPRTQNTRQDDKLQSFMESSILDELSLNEVLYNQARQTFTTPEDLKIAENLIGSLDERGFLTSPIAELALLFQTDEGKLKDILKIIQTFDPPGVGAENLQDALLLQLRQLNKEKCLVYSIIQNNFDDLIHNRVIKIAHDLHSTPEIIEKTIQSEISHLNIHPGLNYSKAPVPYITPDVIIEDIDGELELKVNSDPLPPLRLNKKYLRMLRQEEISTETRKFLEDKIMKAKWLLKTVDQRQSTLERIARSLLQKNREFFLSPDGKMKPLTMKTLADELEVHESTIARAVANKYISCLRGNLPLRSFFTSNFTSTKGEKISSSTIKDLIRDLIAKEDKRNPLSDDKLAEIIKGKGIPCARRTVAKFRSSLTLGNQHQRRKFE